MPKGINDPQRSYWAASRGSKGWVLNFSQTFFSHLVLSHWWSAAGIARLLATFFF